MFFVQVVCGRPGGHLDYDCKSAAMTLVLHKLFTRLLTYLNRLRCKFAVPTFLRHLAEVDSPADVRLLFSIGI